MFTMQYFIVKYRLEPVFSHGQLYVAFSRSTTLNGVKVQIGSSDAEEEERVTKNVVYKEIL